MAFIPFVAVRREAASFFFSLMLFVLGLLIQSLAVADTPRVDDAMKERVRACTACHGKEGVATNQGYFPRIAGKPAVYLYNQLRHFREGRRQNPAMRHLLAHMSDAYLMDIAVFQRA